MSIKQQLLALVATLPTGIGLKELGNAALDAAEKEIVAKLAELLPGMSGVQVQVVQLHGDDGDETQVESITVQFDDGMVSLVGDELQSYLEDDLVVRALGKRLRCLPEGDYSTTAASMTPELDRAISEVHGLLYRLPRVRDLPVGVRLFNAEGGIVARWNAKLPVPDARFPNLALRNTYVYHSPFEEEHSFDRACYWHNVDGWVRLESAHLFDVDDSAHSYGPMDPKGEVKASRLLFHALPELRESIRQINALDQGAKPVDAKSLEVVGIAYRNGDWAEEESDPMAYGLFVVSTDGTKKLVRIWEEYARAYPEAYVKAQDLGLPIDKAAGNRDLSYLSFRNAERKKTAA